VVDCEGGYHCEYGECISDRVSDEDYREGCEDCEDECPGASRTDCVNNRCECYYEANETQYREEESLEEEEFIPEPELNNELTGEVVADVGDDEYLDYFFD